LRVQNLPGFSKLHADYLDQSPSIRAFFPCHLSRESLDSHAGEIRARVYSREELCEALNKQAGEFRCGPKTLENIARLQRHDTLAVVTTAVPALLGGTLSDYLKYLTTIKLADSLDREGVPAVPVFWMRPETAPWGDTTSVRVTEGRWQLALETDLTGKTSVPPQIGDLLARLQDLVPDRTEDRAELHELLSDAYTTGIPLSVAFGRLLSALMEPWGPILIDAWKAEYKSLRFPVLNRFRLNASEIESILDARHEQISRSGYSVDCRSSDHRTWLRNHAKTGSIERNDKEMLEESLELLVFGDALTPVLQHWILPAVANVAGGRQLGCLAETMPLFDYFELQPPVVWPRVSATIMDTRSRKILEKYALRFEDLFAGPEALLQQLQDWKLTPDTVERFDRLRAEVEKLLGALEAALPPEDKSLAPVVDTSRSKMLYQLGKLQDRFEAARTLRREAMARHLDRLCKSLAPERQLQENIAGVEFLLRYSRSLLAEMYDKIDVWNQEHQIISID
jgi:bacillithiol synthase